MADTRDLAAALLHFIEATEPMKNQTRTAWGTTGRHESVAEHSWRLSLLALVAAPYLDGVDTGRLIELCIVHDLGETFEGDISATLQGKDDGKDETERKAVETLAGYLPGDAGERIEELWREYNEATTPEARAAKALDKIETIIQHNQGANPSDFDYAFNLDYGAGSGHGQPLVAAIRELVDQRTAERAAASEGDAEG